MDDFVPIMILVLILIYGFLMTRLGVSIGENLIEDISKKIGKALQIEFSKDINNPNIGIIGAIREGKKVVKFYNVDRNKYTPKLKLKEVSHNKSDLEELECNSEFIGELVFYNNESIESLICVLKELYEV